MKKSIRMIMAMAMIMIIGTGCAKEEKKDVIRVGMELKWPPFETADTKGNPEGISVLLAEELGAYLGKEVEIVDMQFSALITALDTNKIDIILGSMGITEERKEKINFSEPYMYFKILTAVNNKSGIETYDDLFEKEGVRFVAPKSFTTLDIARERAKNPEIKEFDDKATATLELAAGNADVFMVDAVSAVSIARNYPDDIFVIYEPVHVAPVGVGLRKGDEELRKQVNEFIANMESLGVNDKVKEQYEDTLMELVGKGYDFYLHED